MKKPSLIIGKKQIILSCLTLMLAVAVYVNYAVTSSSRDAMQTGETAGQKNVVSYGDTEFVRAEQEVSAPEETADAEAAAGLEDTGEAEAVLSGEAQLLDTVGEPEPLTQAEGQSAADYFAQARLNRSESRDERVAALQTILGAGDRTEDELVTDAIAAVETSQRIESEGTIETIVKSMGYSDCIVYLGTDSAKVVVQTEGLDAAQAAAIKDVILGEITIPAENIRLFEVK